MIVSPRLLLIVLIGTLVACRSTDVDKPTPEREPDQPKKAEFWDPGEIDMSAGQMFDGSKLTEMDRVKREQLTVTVINHYKTGRNALINRDYDTAIHHFQKVLDVCRGAYWPLACGDAQKRANDILPKAKLWKKDRAWFTNRVENSGLFWHFVDLVWIFLFPILYLLPGKGVVAGH